MSPMPLSFRWAVRSDPGSGAAATRTATARAPDIGLYHRRRRHGRPRGRRGRVARGRRCDPGVHRGDRRRRQEPHLAVSVRSRRSASTPTASRRRSASPTGASPARSPTPQDLRGMATTASALLAGHRVGVRRARRRQPRLRAARRHARADHPRSLLGRRAGPRRHDDARPPRGSILAQRRHARAVGRRRSGSRRRPSSTPLAGRAVPALLGRPVLASWRDDADRADSRPTGRRSLDEASAGG